jgi:hypothetical protein
LESSDSSDTEENEAVKPPPNRKPTRTPKKPVPKKPLCARPGKVQIFFSDTESEPPTPPAPKKRKPRRKRVLPALGALQLSYNPIFHPDTNFVVGMINASLFNCRTHEN